MTSDVVSTGCARFDNLLGGGFPVRRLTLIYGESGTGKTTLAFQSSVACARKGFQAIYVNPGGFFHAERLMQIGGKDSSRILSSIMLFTPRSFGQQTQLIERMDGFITSRTALVVVDTITSLYRLELGGMSESLLLNKQLNRQLAYLADLALCKRVSVLVLSQVRGKFSEGSSADAVEPVATRVLKFWSDVIVHMEPTEAPSVKRVVLEKPSLTRRPFECRLKLVENGIREA